MEAFVKSLKRKYHERLIVNPENQYPPCRRDKFVKLELVEGEKNQGYASNWQRGENRRSIKRSPIECDKVFESGKSQAVRRVLVEGDAGIGKTTFSVTVTVDWADGKLLGQFQLVLLLPLRDKRVAAIESLYDLVKLFHSSSHLCSSVVNTLEETEGEDVLIVADGWDELSDANREPESFLHRLLFGEILPFSSLLLTSRPSASTLLHKSTLINRYVEVVGFSKENIIEFIQSEFKDDADKATNLLQQLETNPLIASICTVPLNCAIVCHLQRTLKQSLPQTMTELYTMIILQTLYRNITKYPQYKNMMSLSSFESLPDELQAPWHRLCQFAFLAIEKDQLVFSEEELSAIFQEGATSTSELLCFGLVQSAHSILTTEAGYGLSFHFVHLTFQEYLAALHLVRQSPDVQLAVCRKYGRFNLSRFERIWIFFFGIACNSQLAVNSCNANNMQKVMEKLIEINRNNFSSCFLSHCCFESKHDDFSTMVAQMINGRFELDIIRTAHDCSAVIHVLSYAQFYSSLNISFNGCKLGDNGVIPLANVLKKKSNQIQVEELNLSGNNLSDSGVSTLFSAACDSLRDSLRLDLHDNEIREKGVYCIVKAFSAACPNRLSALDLSNNPLGVFGLQVLEDALLAGTFAHLKCLRIAGTLSHDPDINGAVLATFLRSLSAELNELDLSKNNLSVPGAQAIGTAVSHFSSTENLLTRRISYDDLRLMLVLDEAMLGDEGVKAFTDCLDRPCSLQLLSLIKNELHSQGVLALSQSITSKSAVLNLSQLALGNNPLGLQGMLAICKMLGSTQCQIKCLFLSNCCLTLNVIDHDHTNSSSLLCSSDVADLIQQLQRNNTLHHLNVSGSNFSNDNCILLSSLISLCTGLFSLVTNQCGITSDDVRTFFSQLSKHPCKKLDSWTLTGNNICDEGIQLFVDSIPALLPNINHIFINLFPDSTSEYARSLKLDDAIRRHRKERVRYQTLRLTILSRLSQKENEDVGKLIYNGIYSTSKFEGSTQELKGILILVYLEALCLLSPCFPHQPPTITLDVVEKNQSQCHEISETQSIIINNLNTTLPQLKHVFSPGLRVVRGRDWEAADEDGGEGHVGTLLKIEDSSCGGRMALVQWDCGNTGLYRCGVERKFDLRVFDSALTGATLRQAYIRCDYCDQGPLFGMWWNCSECSDCNLCSQCYHKGICTLNDSLKHTFVRYDCSTKRTRVKVPPRDGSRRIEAVGIFSGAVVVRGPDWDHGNDDGGEGGTVTGVVHESIMPQNHQTITGMEVLWSATNKKTKCRLGHDGKVDVKCITPSSGGYYYPDHLPMLGAPYSVQQEQADKVKELLEASIQPHDTILHANEDETPGVSSERSQVDQQLVTATGLEETDYHGHLSIRDLKCVRTALWDVRSKWYDVGIELEVNTSSLDTIREDCHHKVDNCFTAMLKVWLETPHPPPTWCALIEALKSPPIDNPQLAEKLQNKYTAPAMQL